MKFQNSKICMGKTIQIMKTALLTRDQSNWSSNNFTGGKYGGLAVGPNQGVEIKKVAYKWK